MLEVLNFLVGCMDCLVVFVGRSGMACVDFFCFLGLLFDSVVHFFSLLFALFKVLSNWVNCGGDALITDTGHSHERLLEAFILLLAEASEQRHTLGSEGLDHVLFM